MQNLYKVLLQERFIRAVIYVCTSASKAVCREWVDFVTEHSCKGPGFCCWLLFFLPAQEMHCLSARRRGVVLLDTEFKGVRMLLVRRPYLPQIWFQPMFSANVYYFAKRYQFLWKDINKQLWCTEGLAEGIENLTVKRSKTTRNSVMDTVSLGFVVLVFQLCCSLARWKDAKPSFTDKCCCSCRIIKETVHNLLSMFKCVLSGLCFDRNKSVKLVKTSTHI